MSVEKLSDELWIGAKDQSNSVIAGSLRNILRDSLTYDLRGESTDCPRDLTGLPTTVKLRIPLSFTVGVRLWGISFIVERETTQIAV